VIAPSAANTAVPARSATRTIVSIFFIVQVCDGYFWYCSSIGERAASHQASRSR
jgi:hypothetical protein